MMPAEATFSCQTLVIVAGSYSGTQSSFFGTVVVENTTGSNTCTTVQQLKVEGGKKWGKRPQKGQSLEAKSAATTNSNAEGFLLLLGKELWEEEEEKEEAAEALHKIEAHEYLFIDKHTQQQQQCLVLVEF